MSRLPLIGTRAQKYLIKHSYAVIVSHIPAPIHCITTHNVNPLESPSLESFIDLSEHLRQRYVRQAVLMHAALGFEPPTGTM